MNHDAIVILTAGSMAYRDHESGEERFRSTTYDERDEFGTLGGEGRIKAAAMLAARYPQAVIVTTSKRTNASPSHARIAADELISLGVDAGRIRLEECSVNTRTQITETFRLAAINKWKHLLFVVSEYQILRAQAFTNEILQPGIDAEFISAESVLIEEDPNFEGFFVQLKKTEAYQQRLVAEARGVEAIRSGVYTPAEPEYKQERASKSSSEDNHVHPGLRIGDRHVGPGAPTYIIFEVASTHENDWETAANYVEQAAAIGADAVKFQLFTADALLNPLTPALKGTYDYLATAETPRVWFPKLKALADTKGIDLLCTPFDISAASFLDKIGVPAVKIASGELTNLQLLEHVASLGKPVLVSTGMAMMDEIDRAVCILRDGGARDIALLQCVSVYPTSFEDANVRAMCTLSDSFGTVSGYSDNGSEGMLVPLMAVAMGASIIEKHVTAKKERGSIDDKFSLSIEAFAELIRRIRAIDARDDKECVLSELREEFGPDFDIALGDGVKRPAPFGTVKTHPGINGTFVQKESDERRWARRGVYLSRPMIKGERIEQEDIVLLRPDIGVSGGDYETIIGMTAAEDLPAFCPIKRQGKEIALFRKTDIASTYNALEDTDFVHMLEEEALFE